jgi:CheY-like chemotaxis protein
MKSKRPGSSRKKDRPTEESIKLRSQLQEAEQRYRELRDRTKRLSALAAPLRGTVAEGEKTSAQEDRRIRILVVDDHVIMRQGLACLLQAQPDMEVVGEASNGESAIKMARQFLPDVIVMDVSMPVMNGADATRVIHSEMPDVQVIGLSMFDEEEKGEAMRRAGAVRYLTQTGPSNALIAAIRESARRARQRSVAQ